MDVSSIPVELLGVSSPVNNASVALYNAAVSANLFTGNLMVSPVSIIYCTMLVYFGVKGPARDNIRDAFGLKMVSYVDSNQDLAKAFGRLMDSIGATDKKLQLSLANEIFVDKQAKIQNDYITLINSTLHASLATEDLCNDPKGSAGHINAWIEENTGGKIRNLVTPEGISKATKFVLANAMYFKSEWQWGRFDSFLSDFTLEDLTKNKTNLLRTTQEWNRYTEEPGLGAQYLEIPYAGNKASLLLFLPFELAGLRKLEKRLTLKALQETGKNAAEGQTVLITIVMPKFRLESEFDAIALLNKIGITKAFHPTANYSGMLLTNDSVTDFKGFHKTFIDVNEQGTEAAAVTVFEDEALAEPPPPLRRVEFIANRPFLYAIRHNPSGAFLLMGRMEKP